MRRGFELKYTDEQRDAVAFAYEDRNIRPAERVRSLAASGELEWKGKKLEPFDIPVNTIRDLAKKLRRGRQGRIPSQMSGMSEPDAREAARRRCWNAWDALMQEFERQVKREPGKVDPKRLRELAIAEYDIARMPTAADAKPTGNRVLKQPGEPERKAGRGSGKTMGPLIGAMYAKAGQVPETSGQVPESAAREG